ncbi:MAG: efflux RND transporter periplasmic adaptor subunit [Steroidobacteraceae bacterium]|jgi:RND family efflux transporter MFP subunit
MTPLDTTSPPKRKFRIAWAVSLLAVLLAIGIIPRVLKNREARDAALASPVLLPEVIVVHPRLGAARTDISLPGNLQPLYRAAVFARTNGYIESRSVDIGSEVKAGQVLAVISAPEVDQQLNQAHADALEAAAAVAQSKAALEQAQANRGIARITQKRYASLIDKRAVTQQSLDEADEAFRARSADVSAAAANISAAEATLKSRQANVERLTQMQGFERVVAPFDGVITARNIEVGDLVSAGSDNGSMSLFSIAQSNVLRVQVEVPQSAALAIKVGQQATITVQERPGRRYVATVTRSARSIDVAARTMLTEVQVDNRDGSLVPGMYGEVNFDITVNHPSLIIPSTALVIDKNGMHVVSVSADRRVHFVAVDIGQDQGSQVEISQGLRGGETLVSNPSDLLRDGERVSIVE